MKYLQSPDLRVCRQLWCNAFAIFVTRIYVGTSGIAKKRHNASVGFFCNATDTMHPRSDPGVEVCSAGHHFCPITGQRVTHRSTHESPQFTLKSLCRGRSRFRSQVILFYRLIISITFHSSEVRCLALSSPKESKWRTKSKLSHSPAFSYRIWRSSFEVRTSLTFSTFAFIVITPLTK